ncbi:MAG: carboxypeptidase-like regulatory domain-containing protein [Planctomycetota bacterium]
MRATPVLLTVALLTAGAAFLLTPRRSDAPATDQTGVAMDPVSDRPQVPERSSGKLVLRVVTEDGRPLPKGTRAGYVRYGDRRLRLAAADGTFPFADAPVGRLEVTAEAPGYLAPAVTAVLTPGVPTEATIVLAPVR